MAKLTANTVVVGIDGVPVPLFEGGAVPDWATDLVGEHLLADEPASEGGEPPRSGKGSGIGPWRDHAAALGLDLPTDASREDIIAAVDDLAGE